MRPRHSSRLMASPALAAAVLLYGIVFLFALAYYAGMPWQRIYTIALYSAVAVWSGLIIIARLLQSRPSLNTVDILFAIFTISLLISVGMNWGEGGRQQLMFMPFFFFLPYCLGRVVNLNDCKAMRGILVIMGGILLFLIFPEYVWVLKYGLPYINSPAPILFGFGHGVMLSGLMLSVAIIGLVSILLSHDQGDGSGKGMRIDWQYPGYALLLIMVVAIGWITARGPALATILGVAALLLLTGASPHWRRLQILIVLALGILIAVVNSMQRKANIEFYANLIRSPVQARGALADGTVPMKGEVVYKSILGAGTCERIVDSITDRWVHYEQAVAVFLANPWFGAGANQYGDFACSGPGSFPHNTILQVFAELGVFVGIIYCGLILMTLWRILQFWWLEQRDARSILLWLFIFAVIQVLIAQINGNYFISATLYFAIGVAANLPARSRSTMEVG